MLEHHDVEHVMIKTVNHWFRFIHDFVWKMFPPTTPCSLIDSLMGIEWSDIIIIMLKGAETEQERHQTCVRNFKKKCVFVVCS